MRFHEFLTPEEEAAKGWIDLDRIHAICPHRLHPERSVIATPNGAVVVRMPVADVLALLRPAQAIPAPMTPAELEQLHRCDECGSPTGSLHDSGCSQNRRRHEVLPTVKELKEAAERLTRLDELDRLDKAASSAFPSLRGSWLAEYIEKRRFELVVTEYDQ